MSCLLTDYVIACRQENDFEPADDMLPDEREVVQSTRHASLRDFTQAHLTCMLAK